jgi:hypothetical protein
MDEFMSNEYHSNVSAVVKYEYTSCALATVGATKIEVQARLAARIILRNFLISLAIRS